MLLIAAVEFTNVSYLVFHEQDEPCHHNVDCIPQARILEQFGNLTSRETRKDQS